MCTHAHQIRPGHGVCLIHAASLRTDTEQLGDTICTQSGTEQLMCMGAHQSVAKKATCIRAGSLGVELVHDIRVGYKSSTLADQLTVMRGGQSFLDCPKFGTLRQGWKQSLPPLDNLSAT